MSRATQQREAAKWMRAHSSELAAFELPSEPVTSFSSLDRAGAEGGVMAFIDNVMDDEINTLGFLQTEATEEPEEWDFL